MCPPAQKQLFGPNVKVCDTEFFYECAFKEAMFVTRKFNSFESLVLPLCDRTLVQLLFYLCYLTILNGVKWLKLGYALFISLITFLFVKKVYFN